jgi:hypothetical protein
VATNFAGEPVDPARDLVAMALRGMGFAISLGSAVAGLVLWIVRQLVGGAPAPEDAAPPGAAAALLLWGTLLALGVSAAAAWHRLEPIGSYYRRGGLSLVCGFATFIVAVLAAPLHHWLGSPGLLGLVAAGLVGALVFRRPPRPVTP